MDAYEEVADTFSDSDCTDFFSSRMGSLNLSFTSSSYDPAFSFNTSSRSSSLRLCDVAAGTTATDTLAPAPALLPAVTPPPCASSGRHFVLARRSSSSAGPDPNVRSSTSGWPARPAVAGPPTETPVTTAAPAAAARTTGAGSQAVCPAASLAGFKRRSWEELSDVPGSQQQQQQQQGAAGDAAAEPSSGPSQPTDPPSPTASFASFAAALAAHYFESYGSVPDVPAHMEEMRLRGSKRQRVLSVEGLSET